MSLYTAYRGYFNIEKISVSSSFIVVSCIAFREAVSIAAEILVNSNPAAFSLPYKFLPQHVVQ